MFFQAAATTRLVPGCQDPNRAPDAMPGSRNARPPRSPTRQPTHAPLRARALRRLRHQIVERETPSEVPQALREDGQGFFAASRLTRTESPFNDLAFGSV